MKMMISWVCVLFIVAASHYPDGVEGIGVNWGTQSAQSLHPETIVQLLKDNNISKVKLFDSDPWTVEFFADTDIDVMLGIPNDKLASLADSYGNAKNWVLENLTDAYDNGVKISYVAVGNEPFLKSYNGSNLVTTFPALKNIQKAIDEAGLGDKVKATIPQNADVYETSTGYPSGGQFRADIKALMTDIVTFLRDNNSPFLVNVYPFLSLYQNHDFPVNFAFFDGGATPLQDKGVTYSNMLDANLDTLVWSLKNAGITTPNIVVGEIGWPTDGDEKATVAMAEKFYKGFLKKMAAGKGTPLYPKKFEYYLFSLTDENQKSVAPGDFERHWGIFQYDGQPKYPINFQGAGGQQMPVAAKNVKYMESKWCVFNSDIKIMDGVQAQVQYACENADCTALNHNSSCGSLNTVSKASYAFNSYFQMQNQDVRACKFNGMAKIVTTNATQNGCLFPLALEVAAGWRLGVHVGPHVVLLAWLLYAALFA